MGSELPNISAVTSGAKGRIKWSVLTILLATCALLLSTSQLDNHDAHTRYHVVPINAQEILSECASRNTIPGNSVHFHFTRVSHTFPRPFQGPPSNFADRRESDRYEPDTLPTLITNATIWTGNKSGKEVILKGEIFMDRGIIKYVGDRAPDGLVSDNR